MKKTLLPLLTMFLLACGSTSNSGTPNRTAEPQTMVAQVKRKTPNLTAAMWVVKSKPWLTAVNLFVCCPMAMW